MSGGGWQTKFSVSSRLRSQSHSHRVRARVRAWARGWPEPEPDNNVLESNLKNWDLGLLLCTTTATAAMECSHPLALVYTLLNWLKLFSTNNYFCWLRSRVSECMYLLHMHIIIITSFTSTNVKLRLRFDVHLTFYWHSHEPQLTTWPSSVLPLTLT